MEHGQYDQAIDLGERYEDFQLLVQLCEGAGDRERVKAYVVRFAEQGFAEFLFKHYLDRGTCTIIMCQSIIIVSKVRCHAAHGAIKVQICLAHETS